MSLPITPYPNWAKLLHLGLAVFGIAAYATGELAEGGPSAFGYLLHAYLGLSLGAVMLTRFFVGLGTRNPLAFRTWRPLSRAQRQRTAEDIRTLFRGKLPERDHHNGLAGVVQAAGLILFFWMSLTGTALFLLGDSAPFVGELHEVGESLIPLYLGLHVGAVVLHALAGDPVWKRMFSSR
ncbi:cytochrome b/b6 domain-containing protein [Ferrimonas gelatinilytica]|uniref:Cytochrome b561 bacterial/Ni-hydrogenase domain-containing protein n=1 Tax=Ferrimonas gelatinilytica TaxID=1255257 RepID=A0ABP9S5J9_9GAMM